VLAEWEAWAIAGQQQRWRLVAICPGHVYGPPMTANLKCGELGAVQSVAWAMMSLRRLRTTAGVLSSVHTHSMFSLSLCPGASLPFCP
jgi:hypothetical protein